MRIAQGGGQAALGKYRLPVLAGLGRVIGGGAARGHEVIDILGRDGPRNQRRKRRDQNTHNKTLLTNT